MVLLLLTSLLQLLYPFSYGLLGFMSLRLDTEVEYLRGISYQYLLSEFPHTQVVIFTVFNPRPVDANVRARWQVL